MAEERAALDAQSQRIHAQNYQLMLDRTASEDVMRRKYRARLPPVYEGLNLFQTQVLDRAIRQLQTGLRHLGQLRISHEQQSHPDG